MSVWYVRDNSTLSTATGFTQVAPGEITVGSVGWSAVTAWSASASIAPGTIIRQSAGSAVFTASASTTTLTVSAMTSGTIYLGMRVEATGTSSTFTISAYGTGTGGTGTYTLSSSASTVASTTWNGVFTQGMQRCYVAVQSTTGTTGSTQPNWSTLGGLNISNGSKVTDNTVTWIECTGKPAVNGDLTNTTLSSSVRSTAVATGRIITDNTSTHIFIASTTATTASGNPTFNTTAVGNTTTDGSVTWIYIGTSFSNWAAPFATITQATPTWLAAADTVYTADDHAEFWQGAVVTSGAGTDAAGPISFYSIDHTLSLPVSSSGLKVGASMSNSGGSGSSLEINGNAYYYGFTFIAGVNSSSGPNLDFGISSGHWVKLDTCALVLATTGASQEIQLSNNADTFITELYNTTMQFANVGQGILVTTNSKAIWRNTPNAIAGATIPTTFHNTVGSSGVMIFEGIDLSAITGTLIQAGSNVVSSMNGIFQFIDCKFNSGVTIATTPLISHGPDTDVVRCSSDSKTYVQRRYRYSGTSQEEATIIRTGGASDGTTGISWNITTSALSVWVDPFESFPIAIWNGVTASNRTITLHGIWNSASLPNNDQIWVDVAYLGSASSPLASFASGTKTNGLASGSALTADSSSAWDSVASARQNSHAYSLGNVIKTSSNAGRIFFCTTAGTSNGTEPGGYAGAADGGSVTDGTAVFRAGTRFLLTVTLSTPQPQLVGYLRAYVKAAKVSSTFYVDPLIVLS